MYPPTHTPSISPLLDVLNVGAVLLVLEDLEEALDLLVEGLQLQVLVAHQAAQPLHRLPAHLAVALPAPITYGTLQHVPNHQKTENRSRL